MPQGEESEFPSLDAKPEVADALKNIGTVLAHLHGVNQGHSVVGPDAAGVFPSSPLRSPLPIVVDANTLFQDIAYSCHHDGQPTILVNGANAGLFRLYMAKHVAEELDEYREAKPSPGKISETTWVRVWNSNYRPLMRLVDSTPKGLLLKDEIYRVRELGARDEDDVPTAVLSILAEGFLLSEDRHPNDAVYGADASRHDRLTWRDQLRSSGNSGVITQYIDAAVIAGGLVGSGVAGAFRFIARRFSVSAAIATGVAGLAIAVTITSTAEPEKRQKAREWIATIGRHLAAVMEVLDAESSAVASLIPIVASVSEQRLELGPDRALVRQLIRTMARMKSSHHSAAELALALSGSDVPHSEARVREALRANGVFTLVGRGRWQLGKLSRLLE